MRDSIISKLLLACVLGASVPAQAADDFSTMERDGVRIESGLHAQLYSWRITNSRPEPITRFEMNQHNAYSQRVPAGWEYEYVDDRFVAWATERQYGIQQSATAEFTARIGSDAAILGLSPASIAFGGSDDQVSFDAIWAPVQKPWNLIWVVIAMICGLAVIHMILLRRKPLHDPPLPSKE